MDLTEQRLTGMKHLAALTFGLILIYGTTSGAQKQLLGTWCVKEQALILTFFKGDSIAVTSEDDSSIHGKGIYSRTDTTFHATVINGDMTLRMMYNYVFMNDSTVKAQAVFMTLNGDSVDHPTELMEMNRCKTKVASKEVIAKEKPAVKKKQQSKSTRFSR